MDPVSDARYDDWLRFNATYLTEDPIEVETTPASYDLTQSSDRETSDDIESVVQTDPGSEPDGALPLLQLADWDENKTYDDQPPTCVHYTIEWKLTLNTKAVARDTEPDLVLAPGAFWTSRLRPKLQRLLDRKLPPNKSFHADDTTVTVSVSERSERDLVKQFDELDIDWAIVEKRLRDWSRLLRAGKKLRIAISFNYTEAGSTVGADRPGARRGRTQHMLSERAMQLDAEEGSGQPSIWRATYNLMRCPGPPCHLGPYCWRDPVGQKHYRLKTHHLRGLIRYVELGGRLETHDDVPEETRRQLYAEEQQDLERRRNRTAAASGPPIHITNVLPGQSPQGSVVWSPSSTVTSAVEAAALPSTARLAIPGLRDEAIQRYTEWQCSQMRSEAFRREYRSACDLTLGECLNLQQVHEDQDVDFYVAHGVKRGVARSFVSDIEVWVREFA